MPRCLDLAVLRGVALSGAVVLCALTGRCPGAGHGVLFSGERVIIYNEWFWCLLGECVSAIRAGLGEPERDWRTEMGTGGCPESESVGPDPCLLSWPRLLVPLDPEGAAGSLGLPGWQVPAPVSAFRAASATRFCTLGAPAVAMEMPTLCLNGKSCLWPWSRGSGHPQARARRRGPASHSGPGWDR